MKLKTLVFSYQYSNFAVGVIQIATNGIIKIPEDIKATIWVSIDGNKETHNKIRGAKIYDKVIKNITDDPRITISTTLSTTNYKQVHEIVNNCIKTGVSGIFFMLYSGTFKDPLLLTGDKLKKTIRDIYQVLQGTNHIEDDDFQIQVCK